MSHSSVGGVGVDRFWLLLSLAERVASERNEAIGETVGYQIRLENRCSARTYSGQ